MYVPLRHKMTIAARLIAGLWYRTRVRAERQRRALAPHLREQEPAEVVFGLGANPAAIALSEEERSRILLEAEAACRGRLFVGALGEIACGDPIDWHRDPVTGCRFPDGFFDIERDPMVDWRFCDEINLHRHFYPLAQAYYLTGEDRFAAALRRQLWSWIDVNPPILNRFWHSALQCAIRVVAWVWILHALRRRSGLSPDDELALIAAIREHARFVERHSEPRSYNHLIGEAAALAIAGIAVPYLPESARWRALGLQTLTDEVARQFGPEGNHREQSLGYHAFVLDAYTQALVLAQQNGVPVDPRLCAGVERMYDFVLHLMRPDGLLPNFGDEGLPWHQLSRRDLRDARRLLSTGAALFGRGDLKWAAGELSPDTEWLLGPTGRARFAALDAHPPATTSVWLADSGVLVLRGGWEASDSYVLLDAGPQGVAHAGHGHADALSFELVAAGAPLLVDSGTFTYNMRGAEAWRRYFRGTSGHSTLTVDGADQADSTTRPFAWENTPHTQLRGWHRSPRLELAWGEHDGYQRLSQPVRHRRLLFWVVGEYWVVCDVLTGIGSHRGESFFHFASIAAALDDDGLTCRVGDAGHSLTVIPAPELSLRACLTRGQLDPPRGWLSRGYGHREPAPVLVYSQSGPLPLSFAVALVPARGKLAPTVRLTRSPVHVDRALQPEPASGAVKVALGPERSDWLLWSAAPGRKTAGEIGTDGALAYVRVEGDGATRGICVGGTFVLWGGAEVELEPVQPVVAEGGWD